MINANIKRIFMITDLHFGVRSNSLEWLEFHKSYFYDFFIPLIKSNKKPNDAIFILGDIFESRQTINILVLNEALKIFKTLSNILPIYMLIGNHDCYRKSTSDIYSPIIFNNFDNITVFNNAEIIKTHDDVKLLMMPWQENSEKELDVVKNNNADYLFCHTHFSGIRFNKKVTFEDGLDINEVAKFKTVYSGHIHYAQTLHNVRMIGCIFPLTRSDMGNHKRVILLDLDTGVETEYINDYSHEFIKFKIDDIVNLTQADLQEKVKNNFVDVLVEGQWISKFPYSQLIDLLQDYKKINYILSTLQKDYENDDMVDEEINLNDLIVLHIESLTYADNTKKNLIDVSNKLYKKAIKYMQEKINESDI